MLWLHLFQEGFSVPEILGEKFLDDENRELPVVQAWLNKHHCVVERNRIRGVVFWRVPGIWMH